MRTTSLAAFLLLGMVPLVACRRVEHRQVKTSEAQVAPAPPSAPVEPAAVAAAANEKRETEPVEPAKAKARKPDAREKPVLDGLKWLARHRSSDGSWSPAALKSRCSGDPPCYDAKVKWTDHYDVGLTGLALLGFLGAGFTPDSKEEIPDAITSGTMRPGEILAAGLHWLVGKQNDDGWFSPGRAFMYNEILATMALVEAYRVTHADEWKIPAQKAVDFLQGAQRPSPSGDGLWGWRYQSRQELEEFRKRSENPSSDKEMFDSDTSVTGWGARALAVARTAGLKVSDDSLDGAFAFTEWATANDGLVGYINAKGAGATVTGPNDHFVYHHTSMSAIGMCTRMFLRHDPSDAFLEIAAKRLIADLPTISKDKLSVDYYYWHYATIALNQLDGPDSPAKSGRYQHPWNKAALDAVLSLQDHAEGGCSNGGWVVGDRWSYTGGPIYSTAINVLTLETLFSNWYMRYGNKTPNVSLQPPVVARARAKPAVGTPASRPPGFRVADERGKVVLLACWSPLAKSFQDDLAEGAGFAAQFDGRPFTLAAVVYDSRAPRRLGALDAAAWKDIQKTVADSLDHPLLREYKVDSFPTLIVIDADGVLRARDLTWDETTNLIERLVSEAEARPKPR